MRYVWLLLAPALGWAQTGVIQGTITLDATGEPMHAARVVLSPLGRSTDTSDEGRYSFTGLAAGIYDLTVQAPGMTAAQRTIELQAGITVTVDLKLKLATLRESLTVTATGREESTMSIVQSVLELDQSQLPLRAAASLGEVLNNEPGVAKRSSGPGSSRPVIRGFDGDRVLILEDGMRTGTLSSQSGDHGEPVDVNKLERLEVVRGPATLLYGSNAVGGVVNAISRRDVFHPHVDQGLRGYLTGSGGSNNAQGGGGAGFEYGLGHWELWASGGGQRTSDYRTQLGPVKNSQSRMEQADIGFGHYADKSYFNFNYGFTDSLYGIPYDPSAEDPEIAELLMRRHNWRFTTGWKDVGAFENIQAKVNYSDYGHQELVNGRPETDFFNNQLTYRMVLDQKQRGRLTGSSGVWGMHRDYKIVGDEQIAPPTKQNGFAVFTAQNLEFDRTRISFGARLETNRYNPAGRDARSFTGLSAAAGVSHRLWQNGAVVANYSHSFRAPALEELYNFGPHPGNQTFEIGNPDLKRERNDGIDVSLRHQASRLRAEVNFFHYNIRDFVYLAPTGNVEDGLPEANYAQEHAHFTGAEGKLDIALHPSFWLNLAVDGVRAKLTDIGAFLPRIPPVRGRLGFEARYKGLSLQPEVVLANAQSNVFPIETPTAGYAVVNIKGSYTLAQQHHLHLFSAELFNAGDTLYRNHLSFLKAFAPEMGRGVRVSYTLQVF